VGRARSLLPFSLPHHCPSIVPDNLEVNIHRGLRQDLWIRHAPGMFARFHWTTLHLVFAVHGAVALGSRSALPLSNDPSIPQTFLLLRNTPPIVQELTLNILCCSVNLFDYSSVYPPSNTKTLRTSSLGANRADNLIERVNSLQRSALPNIFQPLPSVDATHSQLRTHDNIDSAFCSWFVFSPMAPPTLYI
jgi:hypothetical protein